jgi:hypothetical protein
MSIRAPIFLLASGNDEIAPADQLLATAQLVGTPAEQLVKMTEPCGRLTCSWVPWSLTRHDATLPVGLTVI